MANILLDHPWRLTDAIDPACEGFGALEAFDHLIRSRRSLTPLRFFEREEYLEFLQWVESDPALRSTALYFRLLSERYVRWMEPKEVVMASPEPNPRGVALPEAWCRALGEAMQDPEDWRNPQIAVCRKHVGRWPTRALEISIRISNRFAIESRLLTVVEEYGVHRFATSDFDPWDLARCRDPREGRVIHPCRLPKPPELEGTPLEAIQAKLGELRERGWRYRDKEGDKYCYIPPPQWNFRDVGRHQWRKECRAFPEQEAGGGRGRGPVDNENRVWVWDLGGKRHWDVQFPVHDPEDDPDYCVISHTGVRVK